MRAVAVLADLPYPPRSGNHLRDLQTLAVLRRLGYDVAVVAGAATAPEGRGVGPNAVLAAAVPVTDLSRSTSARIRRIYGFLFGQTGSPGPWALNYVDAGLDEQVLQTVESLQPEVLVLRSTLAHLLPRVRSRVERIVLDVHDAETLQARTVAGTLPVHRRPGALARVVAGRRLDRTMAMADELWVPSSREAGFYATLEPAARTLVVPNGVDVPPLPEWRNREPELLLIGTFGYPPNRSAAVRLVENVLPLVRSELPEARVTLVGAGLTRPIERHLTLGGATYLGLVDDLGEVYRRPAIAVVPYDESTQSGTPLKVAEAIAHGVPVVAAPNAVEALGLQDGRHVLVGRDDAALARAVVRLVAEPSFAAELVAAAHAWAERHLSPTRIAERLERQSVLGRASLIA